MAPDKGGRKHPHRHPDGIGLSPEGKARRAATRIQRAFKRYKMDHEKSKRDRQKHRNGGENPQGGLGDGKPGWSYTVKVIATIATWYTLSTTLTVFNKAVYGAEHGKFPAPLLVTGSGMFLQYFLCKFFFLARSFLKGGTSAEAWEAMRATSSNVGEDGQSGWLVWWRRYATVSFMTGLDYGASNLSLVYITLSFYTMCKSSSPLFLLLFAFLLRLEQPSWKLTGIMGIIMTGVMLSVYGELKFNAFGFILVMFAAFLSGCRWGYVQLLLQQGSWFGKGQSLTNSVITLCNMAPLMSSVVLFFSLILERPWELVGKSEYFSSFGDFMLTTGFILFSGAVAFLMVLAEFVLVAETSAVTFTVAGALKELLTIFAGMMFFGDRLSSVNSAGLCVLIVGVVLYNFYKVQKLKNKEGEAVQICGLGASTDEDKELLTVANSSDPVFSLCEDEFDASSPVNGVV